MAKKKIQPFIVDPIELAKQAEIIGKELDNPVVNLDRANYVTGTVSFGSLGIDLLTGGGAPPGKVVDIYGPEGAGKCVDGNTLIETELGTIPIKSLFNGTEKNDTCVPLDLNIVSATGINKTSFKLAKKHSSSVTIKTHSGIELTGSEEHPIFVMDAKTETLRFKKLKDVTVNDYSVVNLQHHVWPKENAIRLDYKPEKEKYRSNVNFYTLPNLMDENLAKLLGYIVAEGTISDIKFSFRQKDEKIFSDFCKIFEKCFPDGDLLSYIKEEETPSVHCNSVYILDFLKYLGITVGHSKVREVPQIIFRSPKHIVKAFLQAYMEGGGGIEKEIVISATSASEKLINQLQQLFLKFGIMSRVRKSSKKATNGIGDYKIYYSCYINQEHAHTYMKQIGFLSDRKNNSFKLNIETSDIIPFVTKVIDHIQKNNPSYKSGFYTLPDGSLKRFRLSYDKNAKNLTKYYLQKNPEIIESLRLFKSQLADSIEQIIQNNYYLDNITNITKNNEEITLYDLSVPSDTDTFVANGLVVHNSTLVGHLISNSISANIPCFMYDPECGSDAMYFKALGVNMRLEDGSKNPLFNYFQPTTGESIYRHINRMLEILPDYKHTEEGRPQPTVMFFIDSIAAMLPESLSEDDESNPMATPARSHSYGLRQIKSKLGRKNCTLVFTNQTREKPGMVFGNPEYEPGGAAIKYYPDLKLNIRPKGKDFMERGRPTRYIKIKTPKNKQFVPFLESEDDTLAISLGRGVERGLDSLGYLKMTGQIEKSGKAWYVLNMPNTNYKNTKFQYNALMTLLCTNDFRNLCRTQINDNSAFTMYFETKNWLQEFNYEDPGELSEEEVEKLVDEEINKEQVDLETGEVINVEHTPVK